MQPISPDNAGELALVAQSPQSVLAWSSAWSPSGAVLAVATETGLKLFDTGSWAQIAELGSGASVYCVAFDPTGQWLATGGNGLVGLWDVVTARAKLTLPAHSGAVRALAFSPDSTRLASGGADGLVKVWDLASGRLIRAIDAQAGQVTGIVFLAGGGLLASTGTNGEVTTWDVELGTLLDTYTAHPGGTFAMLGSSDGKELVTSGGDGRIRYWDSSSGELTRELVGGGGVVLGLDRNLVTGRIAWAGLDGRIWDSDVAARSTARLLGSHQGPVSNLAYSPDGESLVSTGLDGEVLVWEASSGRELARPISGPPHGSRVRSLSITADGATVIAGMQLADSSGIDAIYYWDLFLREPPSVHYNNFQVNTLAYDPNGDSLAMGTEAGVMLLGQGNDLASRALGIGGGGAVLWLAFSSDGRKIAWAGIVRGRFAGSTYDLSSGSSVPLPSGRELPGCFAFRPTAYEIAMCKEYGGVQLSGHADLYASGERIRGIAFSQDGRVLATSSVKGAVRVWNVDDGTLLRTLYGPSGGLSRSMAFAPGGQLLAVVGENGDIYIWDTDTWELLSDLGLPQDQSVLVSFDPLGRAIVSSSASGRIDVWGINE